MRRREFISALGSAAAMPFAARGQEPGRTYRLGMIAPSARDDPPLVAFFEELRRSGFIEGQNLVVIPGGLGISSERNSGAAEALVRQRPDVITSDAGAAHHLKRLTQEIPIVVMGHDILADGLVTSVARPSGNITGISILGPELDGKRQDLLIDATPAARRIAALAKIAHADRLPQYQEAARARGVELSIVRVKSPHEIASALGAAKASGVEAINVLATPLFGSHQNRGFVLDRMVALRLPAVYQWPDMAEQGGLMAYGPSFVELYRQRARMVVKVFRGTKPADMPVEQPTRFELVINVKTAKAIGHEIPANLLLRADRVIE